MPDDEIVLEIETENGSVVGWTGDVPVHIVLTRREGGPVDHQRVMLSQLVAGAIETARRRSPLNN